MSKRKGGYAPAFGDGRMGLGKRYATRQHQLAEKFGGTLPADARALAKALGRLEIDIDRVHEELERALKRRRVRDARRLRRQLAGMNRDLLNFGERLNAMVEQQPRDWTDLLRGPRQ